MLIYLFNFERSKLKYRKDILSSHTMHSRHEQILQNLRQLAMKSTMQCKHSAAIVSGGKIISVGINNHCGKKIGGGRRSPSTHAECAAMSRQRSYWVLSKKWFEKACNVCCSSG